MHLLRDRDDPRRLLLVKLLAMGAFSALPVGRALAQVLGERPAKLPPGLSIYRLSGQVSVNGAAATLQTRIGATDTVRTERNSEVAFVVGSSAFLLRESSTLRLEQETLGNALVNAAGR